MDFCLLRSLTLLLMMPGDATLIRPGVETSPAAPKAYQRIEFHHHFTTIPHPPYFLRLRQHG